MVVVVPSRIDVGELRLVMLAKLVNCLDISMEKVAKEGKVLPRVAIVAELKSKNVHGESLVSHIEFESPSKTLEGLMEDPMRSG